MNKERFLAFTDAIIAIIATIMVLEFKTPKTGDVSALREIAIPFAAYTISFFMVLTVWYNHHQLYRDVRTITRRAYLYNIIWLFIMSFFPFTTAWVGSYPTQFLPELIYILIVSAWAGVFHVMEWELHKENHEMMRAELTHSVDSWRIFGINFAALVIVWFWPPIGLVSIALLGILAVVQFFRK
ncbi:MAG: TMEM175 family protein [Streptococcaceae bacterium]|jgi:uncharacterized membrane protein|nr:TMEM175 family protein [Streptococcaceae bacterium]